MLPESSCKLLRDNCPPWPRRRRDPHDRERHAPTLHDHANNPRVCTAGHLVDGAPPLTPPSRTGAPADHGAALHRPGAAKASTHPKPE